MSAWEGCSNVTYTVTSFGGGVYILASAEKGELLLFFHCQVDGFDAKGISGAKKGPTCGYVNKDGLVGPTDVLSTYRYLMPSPVCAGK